jgi:O-acetyl-ADP-ribose deacetylase (regulator of RNase III)
MSIKYRKGDVLDDFLKIEVPHVLCHSANNKKKMGAGFAKQLVERYPEFCSSYLDRYEVGLGEIYIDGEDGENENVRVIHLVAQDGFRNFDTKPKPLRYGYLAECMLKAAEYCAEYDIEQVICPFFGIGYGGANPQIIIELIEDLWIDNGLEVTIYEL